VYAPQWVPHAAALSGVQHPPSDRQNCVDKPHVVRPFAPQVTAWPQLLVAWPHCMLPHAASTSSGSHASTPASQTPQSMGLLQLSVVSPQRAVHQPGSVWHSQKFVAPHT
jgi:hypothetical protein